MHDREFEPGEPGWGDQQDRAETPQNEERRQAATPAALDRKIDKITDKHQDIGNRRQAQPYAVRWLVSQYQVSGSLAAIIAAELGMGGSL